MIEPYEYRDDDGYSHRLPDECYGCKSLAKRLAEANKRIAELEKPLRMLVDAKDYKERYGVDNHYTLAKLEAWSLARQALEQKNDD